MRSRVTAGVASMLLCGLVLVAPANAAFPGQNGKIVFRAGGFSIDTINPDGSGQTPTGHTGQRPNWSADGKKIVYSDVPTDRIHVMQADGSGDINLNVSGDDTAWSPDSAKIAFSRENCVLDDCQSYLFVMNADGSGVTQFPCTFCLYYAPSWSPDGSWIAFWGFPDANPDNTQFGIWKIRPDRTGLTKVFEGDQAATDPDWSPDGSKLVFEYYPGLATVNADGSGFTMLDTGQLSPSLPAWSPDGSQIAFWEFSGHLEVMNLDGTDKRQLGLGDYEGAPSWQPIPGPNRSDYKNAAQFCKADRDFLGDEAFTKKYGTNGNGANAYGKCVSAN
jgi:Tol biopolymer transport system component